MSARTASVITASNRASQGIYSDVSGVLLRDGLVALGYSVSEPVIVTDNVDAIGDEILKALAKKTRLIVTTG